MDHHGHVSAGVRGQFAKLRGELVLQRGPFGVSGAARSAAHHELEVVDDHVMDAARARLAADRLQASIEPDRSIDCTAAAVLCAYGP